MGLAYDEQSDIIEFINRAMKDTLDRGNPLEASALADFLEAEAARLREVYGN